MTDNPSDSTQAQPEAPQASGEHLGKLSLERLEKLTPKEVGDMAVKFASETAYAAAGFANLVAERAREFAEKQRVAMAETNPEIAESSKAFFEQFSAQVNKFVEDLGHTYKDLSDRGRDAVAKIQQQSGTKGERKDAPGMFDIVDDAETAEPKGTMTDAEAFGIQEPGAANPEAEKPAQGNAEA